MRRPRRGPRRGLRACTSARAALREVWDAAVEGRTVDAGAVDALNDVLAHSPHPTLRATLAGVAVDHHHEDDATGEALARVAEPLVERDRRGRHRALPDLRERRLPLGVRGHVARRPAPLVRHELVRQPREGAALPLEAPRGRTARTSSPGPLPAS